MQPSGFRSLFRGRASPAVAAIVLVALFLLSSMLAGVVGGLPALPGGHPASASASPRVTSTPLVTPPASITPLGTVQRESGVFFENDTTFATLPSNRTPCGGNESVYNYLYNSTPYNYSDNYYDITNGCYQGAQSPSTLSLGGDAIGTGYSVLSNQSMVGCSNNPDVETSQVAFAVSSNAGASYRPPVWIGNTTCAYLQALEPSFTLSSNGQIYGAFVEANYGNATNLTFPFNYEFRTDDALAFTHSGNSGLTFHNPVTLTVAGHGNIARPEIAAFGKSIYIVYEDLDNNSSLFLPNIYPYNVSSPIALEEITSTDGGATWSSPVTLPGLNASSGYSSVSPSISVSSTGTVAVAYATNRTCFQSFFGTCDGYGDNIVVSTSTTNGTSWVGPVLVSPNVTGEYQCAGWENYTYWNGGYWYSCYAYMYSWEPSTSVAWSTVAPNDLYVAWSGTFSLYNASDSSYYYGGSSVFSAASNDSGAQWNDSSVAQNTNQFYPYAYYYNPVINDRDGWVYVSYSEENDSYCYPCAPGTYGASYWLATSADGVHWGTNLTLLLWDSDTYVENAFVGYSASMGFSSGGPVVTFSQPALDTYSYNYVYTDILAGGTWYYNSTDWDNETGFADLTTAFVWSGNTTTVNFTETGLPSGTTWNFSLGSASFSSDVPTIQVSNVPIGPGLYLMVPNLADGFWTHYTAFPSVNATPDFTGPANVSIAYQIEYGIQFLVSPPTDPDFDIDFQYDGQYYDFYSYGCPTCYYADPDLPWYFPAGTVLTLTSTDIYSYFPISYWQGTGNGSSTNFGNGTTITVDGVINETAWAGAYGSYTLTFTPEGLPAGTSYNFSFDGSTYSALSPANVTVPNVVTGAYTVNDITAPASGGYEYFGQVPGGDEVYVPASPVVTLNFTYAYVEVGAAAGVVTFHASGLGLGDPWQLTFNGTTYSGNTPWINLTTRPGTFALSSSPVEAAFNDTAEYQPTGVGPTLSVSVGSTYPVNFTPTYRVVVVGSTGGTVTGAGSHWLAPGSLSTYTARADTNYVFLGWTGTGAGSYTGGSANASVTVNGPIQESASFQALPVNRFNLTVNETGLPSGVWWTVDLDGIGYSTTGSTLLIPDLFPCGSGGGGSYAVSVPNAYTNGTSGIRFVASGYPAQTCTNGATQISVTFTEEFLVTPISAGGGSAAVQVNGVPTSSAAWVKSGTTVGIEASPESGYAFASWVGQGPGSYTGLTPDDELTPTGPITETAYFTLIVVPPQPVYSFSFHTGGAIPAGTAWTILFNNTAYASTTSYINVTGYVNSSYSLSVPTVYSADRLSEFTPTGVPASVTVAGPGGTQTIVFNAEYYVSIQSTIGGSVVSPGGSGYVAAGAHLTLNATASVGYSFVGWTGTGTSSYTGSTSLDELVVSGPITEVAAFAPIPPVAASNTGVGPGSTTVIVALAIVGLVAGLGIGYAVFRRRSPPSEGAPSPGGSP